MGNYSPSILLASEGPDSLMTIAEIMKQLECGPDNTSFGSAPLGSAFFGSSLYASSRARYLSVEFASVLKKIFTSHLEAFHQDTMETQETAETQNSLETRSTAENQDTMETQETAETQNSLETRSTAENQDTVETQEAAEIQRINNLTRTFVELLGQFIVPVSDTLFKYLSSEKFCQKTLDGIFAEVVCLALEQILPWAFSLKCFDALKDQLDGNDNCLLNAVLRKQLEQTIYIFKIKEDSEEIKVKFPEKYIQQLIPKIHKITQGYASLFKQSRCDTSYFWLEMMLATIKNHNNLQSLTPIARVNSFIDMFINFVFKQADEITKTSPKMLPMDIYTNTIYATLKIILPAVSSAGTLWSFTNALTNASKKSVLNKKLREMFKERASQPENEKKHIKKQIECFRVSLRDVIKGYFDLFQKQKTFSNNVSLPF
ncbi:MAG: hypothetical protein LBB11_01230 [Puniceicoccales bacterium]|nr:hypothetical protein [Puniceicoccales bacterium]